MARNNKWIWWTSYEITDNPNKIRNNIVLQTSWSNKGRCYDWFFSASSTLSLFYSLFLSIKHIAFFLQLLKHLRRKRCSRSVEWPCLCLLHKGWKDHLPFWTNSQLSLWIYYFSYLLGSCSFTYHVWCNNVI